MAVARMKKITIYASKELREPIFERLRDLGIVQVTSESSESPFLSDKALEESVSNVSDEISRLSYLQSYLAKYNPVEKSFIDGFTGRKPSFRLDEMKRLAHDYDIEAAHVKAKEHEDRLKRISDELSRTKDEVAALSPWEALDMPLSRIGATRACQSALAVFPSSGLSQMDVSIQGKPVFYQVLWEERSESGVWIVVYNGSEADASSVVSAAGGRLVTLKEAYAEDATVAGIIQGLEEKIQRLLLEVEEITKEDRAMAEDLLGVMALTDYYLDKRNLSEVGESVGATAFTLVISGFVKAKDLDRLKTSLNEFTEIELTAEDPDADEDVPVYLENHPIITPFEVITNIFGYPKYNEIDPTPFLAPFFWIFFGMCLGDAVYGIALTLGCWWFIKSQGLKPPGDKLLRLLMYSGVATVIAGAATNSWMADLAAVFLPGTFVERFFNSLALINPIEDPLTMLVVSFAFGIFQVWVGIGVKMLSYFRQGEYMEGILSSGSWLVFLPGLVLWAVSKTGVMDSQIPFYIMAVGALMVMYSASRSQKNILMKPFSGLYGLYGVVGYFSDTMSYSRILALGLASAIIGVVVNKIAQLVGSMIPYVGWVLVPVILVGGHVFNLVINVLGSFIHAGRLQFVEFFTKFFEGGGRPFKPLTRVSQNVSLD